MTDETLKFPAVEKAKPQRTASVTVRGAIGERVLIDFRMGVEGTEHERIAEIEVEFSDGCVVLTDRRSGERKVMRSTLVRPADRM